MHRHRPHPRVAALAGVLCLSAAAAPAGVIRHDRVDAFYTDLAENYPFLGRWGGGQVSGTLIGADWVLTAAHVGVNTASTFRIGGSQYGVAETLVHPDYRGTGKIIAGGDLRLVRLSAAVTGVSPAGYSARRDELGRVGTAVGWGQTGTGLTGTVPGSGGTKRAGRNVLDLLGSAIVDGNGDRWDERLLIADFDSPDGDANTLGPAGDATPLDLEYMFTFGDSGGGTFVDFGGGPVLVGVHSFIAGETPFGRYGDLTADTRVADYGDWIFANTGLRPAFGPAPVPEPTVPALLALAAVGGGLARRRAARPRRPGGGSC